MRAPWRSMLVALCLLAAALLAGCFGLGRGGGRSPTLPVAVAEGPADNSRCHVCHINYELEEVAVTHAKAGIGCEACHGFCDDHCDDEDNAKPPDRMYPPARVNPFCMQCHPTVKLVDVTEHKPALASIRAGKARCTGCHGDHVMDERIVRWDKATGRLLE